MFTPHFRCAGSMYGHNVKIYLLIYKQLILDNYISGSENLFKTGSNRAQELDYT